LNVDAPIALNASGKSGAHHHHRRYRKARTGKPARAFLLATMLSAGKFQIIEPVSLHFLQFVDGSKKH
jgi:hypothetical protein